MASVATYLNFARETEAAFNFYKQVFRSEFIGGIHRMGDVPPQPGMPPLSEDDKKLVMNVQLPITGGHILMGTDAPESMGFTVNKGNNVYIMAISDTREESDRLFKELGEGGQSEMDMADQFWGDYFGSLTDKFGIKWMIMTPGQR
jgi:PhnB protein